eukprot:TRINITY_DN96394_c0_g1_i1.p1 TRINITY_DN96394_c0_g1~~TRINITY_DN96394_c0_g1_i1.p1  ORF type:complete len:160 (+),score=8.13 TRINITY_DN96394_c0_g1_i1:339-818(+)
MVVLETTDAQLSHVEVMELSRFTLSTRPGCKRDFGRGTAVSPARSRDLSIDELIHLIFTCLLCIPGLEVVTCQYFVSSQVAFTALLGVGFSGPRQWLFRSTCEACVWALKINFIVKVASKCCSLQTSFGHEVSSNLKTLANQCPSPVNLLQAPHIAPLL